MIRIKFELPVVRVWDGSGVELEHVCEIVLSPLGQCSVRGFQKRDGIFVLDESLENALTYEMCRGTYEVIR